MFNKFFKTHSELVLVGLAILFVAVIGGFYFWGIKTLLGSFNKATAVSAQDGTFQTSFDLEGARSLNLEL